MEGKRRDVEDRQDSLVLEEGMIVKFPLVYFATFAVTAFQQEELKQPHRRYTQWLNLMNFLVFPEAPDHLPLATLPCLQEQYNHCSKNFWKSSLSKHMLVVHEAGRP